MSEELEVRITRYADRRNWLMFYVDPVTEKKVTRSTGEATERGALRKAGEWQTQLREGTYRPKNAVTWAEVRERYEDEKLVSVRDRTAEAAFTSLNHVERLVDPKRLTSLTADVLSRFQADLRTEGLAEASIDAHLGHLQAMLSWAVSVGLLAKVPHINRPKLPKGKRMKGRPVTGEEFDRMLKKVPEVRKRDSPVWKRYIRGLWLSGLRLEESIILSWDADDAFVVDLTGRRPKFRIYAEAEKGNRFRWLPMAPDFAEFLQEIPVDRRHGAVFKLIGRDTGKPITPKRVSRIVSRIGKQAGVVVNRSERLVHEKGEDGVVRRVKKTVPKFASAHDLRRSFGTRWARHVKPATLQAMMRHASIETTLSYYVDLDADDIADELWAVHASINSFVNTSQPMGEKTAKKPERAPSE